MIWISNFSRDHGTIYSEDHVIVIIPLNFQLRGGHKLHSIVSLALAKRVY